MTSLFKQTEKGRVMWTREGYCRVCRRWVEVEQDGRLVLHGTGWRLQCSGTGAVVEMLRDHYVADPMKGKLEPGDSGRDVEPNHKARGEK